MTLSAQSLSESEFRQLAHGVYAQISAAFDDIDPDLVECETAQGALTLIMADGAKWVLSMQPPVRQMWLAVASRGQAHHFNYDGEQWRDDKGEGLELYSLLQSLLREEAGVDVSFS